MIKYLIQKEFLQIRRNAFLPRLIVMFPIVIMCVMPWVMQMEVKNIVVDVVDIDHTVESMPTILQWISAIVPPRYYIEAMRKLMIMGVGFGEVAREVIVLAIMTVVLLAIALKKFKQRLE